MAKNITVIAARSTNQILDNQPVKIKVTAYWRVSIDLAKQANSYRA